MNFISLLQIMLFVKNKTIVIVAYYGSMIKDADHINGRIVESGTHEYLLKLKGEYYSLVKNQLQLDA